MNKGNWTRLETLGGLATTLIVGLAVASCQGKSIDSGGQVPAGAQVSQEAKRLPDSAFKVAWTPPALPAAFTPAQVVPVLVTFKNTGDQTWPDPSVADPDKSTGGAYAVRLSYRIKHARDEKLVHDYEIRIEIPKPLAPGESATLPIEVKAPLQPGDYLLQFDLVQELYVWFADKGANQLILPIKVS